MKTCQFNYFVTFIFNASGKLKNIISQFFNIYLYNNGTYRTGKFCFLTRNFNFFNAGRKILCPFFDTFIPPCQIRLALAEPTKTGGLYLNGLIINLYLNFIFISGNKMIG